MIGSFIEHFSKLQDPRIERKKPHALMDILVLTICAVASGAEGWEEIAEFGPAQAGVAAAIHSPEKRCAFP
jgi:DDE family transposase